MDRADATLRDAAPIFCSGEAQLIAQHPKLRHVRGDIHLAFLAVDNYLEHQSNSQLNLIGIHRTGPAMPASTLSTVVTKSSSRVPFARTRRSEEHTSALQSLLRHS